MLDFQLKVLREKFTTRLQENVQLKNYTTIRAGGIADALLIVYDADELERFTSIVWELDIPTLVLGSGSNILVSDQGVRGVVIINHAHNISIHRRDDAYHVHAEAGALMSKVARLAINRHLAGLEWAATLPGTVGGAVFGNAGCFGKETSHNFIQAEILHRYKGKNKYTNQDMVFEYRSSILKRTEERCVVLTADFSVCPGDREESETKVETYRQRRLKNQPPGPSMGSIFRNPPEEKAGRLIEAVGLKGATHGGAEISSQHGNFIINSSNGSAQDIWYLIQVIEDKIHQKYGIFLHPEIELIGDWDAQTMQKFAQYQTIQENA
ncbi:MAG: UDP-N-acetylmuramate dehydrogenase [Chloroflexi bacterium]|mgnify:CR=1 FL=1|nr:UDP-N-acetylmuramate dehydrogenase [Chloroflexota bacterium]